MNDSNVVWCGNLSEQVTEEILYELFLQAGPLKRVSLPQDKDGKNRRFGFIDFKQECSVPYAIELLQGTLLYGRPLLLKTRMHNSQKSKVESKESCEKEKIAKVDKPSRKNDSSSDTNVDTHHSFSHNHHSVSEKHAYKQHLVDKSYERSNNYRIREKNKYMKCHDRPYSLEKGRHYRHKTSC